MTVAEVLSWLERQAAASTSYGSHSMAYAAAAEKLRGASDFVDPNTAGIMEPLTSQVCECCDGTGAKTGPRGGRNQCQTCHGDGYIYVKQCPRCFAKVDSTERAFENVRCGSCESQGRTK